MSTVFVELVSAIAGLLSAGTPIVQTRVFTNRRVPLKTGMANAINVSLKASRATRADVAGGPTDWLTAIAIDCQARVASGDDAVEAVDPILAEAYERLAGVGAELMQGVEDVLPDPDIQWDVEEGDTPLATATFVVRIRHRTQASTLLAWN